MKKMKLLIQFTLILAVCQLYAQDSASLKPAPGEFGIQLRASGIGPLINDNWSQVFSNNELHLKYAYSERRYYTLGFYVNSLSEATEERDSVRLSSRRGLRTISHSESQTGFVIIPGIEFHFPGTRRIDPFISGQLPFGYIGRVKVKDEDVENSIKTNGQNYHNEVVDELITAGGIIYGLRGALGLNYYITNRISLGIDYTISFTFTSLGGDIKDTHSTKVVDGNTTTTTNSVSEGFEENTQFEFSNKGVLGLNFVFFLGKLK